MPSVCLCDTQHTIACLAMQGLQKADVSHNDNIPNDDAVIT